MIIESHAHYSHPKFDQSFRCLFYKDNVFSIEDSNREAIMDRLVKRGFSAFIEPAIGIDSNEKVYALSEKYKGLVFPAYGCHPTRTFKAKLKDRKVITYYASKGCVAIGETGLDYHYARKDQHRLRQKIWFRYQIKLAYKLNKPLILHIRSASDDALKILRKNRKYIVGGVAHCFCDDYTVAQAYTELGLYIGIGGALLTEDCKDRLTEVIKRIPLEFIVAETDAPYLNPDIDLFGSKKQKNKVRNTSEIIIAVIERIAQIKNISVSEVEKALFDNTVRLFHLT